MAKGTVTLLTNDLGRLSQAPHVMTQFIDMLVGKQPLRPEQQEQRWEHLAHCLECQIFLGSYLVKLVEYDKVKGNPTEAAQIFLTQLTTILHETLKEDIPAYVEALEERSEEEARRKFPLLSEHVLLCQDCQAAVEDLRVWLRHLKEAELV